MTGGSRPTEVVVTGTAMLSVAGAGPEPVLAAARAGRTHLPPSGPATLPPGLLRWPAGRQWADVAKYVNDAGRTAVSVACEAWAAGGGIPGGVHADGGYADGGPGGDPRSGVVVGLGVAGADELGSDTTDGLYPELAARFATDPRPLPTLLYDEVPDFAYLRGLPSMAGQFVARACGFAGSSVAVNGEGSAGGLGALAVAVRLVACGELDRVMVVAVAPRRTRDALAAADRAERLAGPGEPGGVVPAEGAAAVLVEGAPAARARGAVALARVSGCETVCASDRGVALDTAVSLVTCGRPGPAPEPAPVCRPVVGTAFECVGLLDVVLAVATSGLSAGRPSPRAPLLVTATDHGPASGGAGAALIEEVLR